MGKTKKDKPEIIDDKDLDETSGGLPAVQKSRDLTTSTDSSTEAFDPTFTGGVFVASK